MPTTVISSIGVGRDHTTIADWITATTGDLVTDDETHIGELYSETYATFNITGATTDATHQRILRAASGHEYDPITDTGAKVVGLWQAMAEEHCECRNFGIIAVSGGGPTGLTIKHATNIADGIFMHRSGGTRGFFAQSGVPTIRNCICHGPTSTGFCFQGIATYENCTAYDTAGVGFAQMNSANATVRNCVAVDCGVSDFEAMASADADYCCSSDATAPGGNSLIDKTSASIFIDEANDDLRMKVGSPCIDAGEDLSGTFTTSIELGATRPVGDDWDIGAYRSPAAVRATISSIGTGKDYTTIAAWESATDNDLVALAEMHIGELYSETYTESINIAGATTDATSYRVLRAATGHEWDPVAGTGAHVVGNNNIVGEEYAQLLNFGVTSDDTGALSYGIDLQKTTCLAEGIFLDRTGYNATSRGFMNGGGIIRNCICAGRSGDGAFHSSGTYQNCVAYGGNDGDEGFSDMDDAGTVMRNCIAVNCAVDFEAMPLADADYCCSSDATAPGGNSVTSQTAASVFVDADNDDFHLFVGSSGSGAGEDLTGTFTTTFDADRSRSAGHGDMGAYTFAKVVISSIGTGKDHNNVNTWRTAKVGDLVAVDEIQIGELYDEEYANFQLKNGTTDADHFYILRAAAGNEYNPVTGTGARVSFSTGELASIEDPYTRVENIGFTNTSTSNFSSCLYVKTGGGNAKIDGCVAIRIDAAGDNKRGFSVIAGETATFLNCIAYGPSEQGGFYNSSSASTYYNCVAYDGERGFAAMANATLRNCVGAGASFADFDGLGDLDYCCSSDATASGANSLKNTAASEVFINASNNNFTLRRGSDVVDVGLDLSSTFTTSIIVGAPRTGLWSMGAYLWVELPARRRKMRRGTAGAAASGIL